jgi:hypothetical protein
MLTYQDEQRVREIIKDELSDIKTTTNKTSDNVDKILSIVTRVDQEHALTQAKVNQHAKRLLKIESKLKIKSPSESLIFA